jgi:hypothetical protein
LIFSNTEWQQCKEKQAIKNNDVGRRGNKEEGNKNTHSLFSEESMEQLICWMRQAAAVNNRRVCFNMVGFDNNLLQTASDAKWSVGNHFIRSFDYNFFFMSELGTRVIVSGPDSR